MNYDELVSIETIPKEIKKSFEQIDAHTCYRDEIRIFSCIKNGDIKKLISEIKSSNGKIFVGQMANSDVMQHKYIAVSTVTLAIRYAIQGGVDEKEAYKFSDEFIRLIDEQKSVAVIDSIIFEKMIELTLKVKNENKKAKHSPHIKKAIAYIDKHITQKIKVTDIANACNLSTDHLSKVFKDEMNENISSYITRKKLELAQSMLFDGADSLSISYALSFSSQSHFISSFKKQFGITPNEYLDMIR
ncbi:MAG: AraC family transcriptional regulator [Clostridiales bacterium]|nr:AraC family transcriptional regulator [Clostridiales bacterium]